MANTKTQLLRLACCLAIVMTIAAPASAQPLRNEWIDYSKTYYKFPITSTRLYRITHATLSANGLANTPPEHFKLFSQGEEIPIYISSGTQPLQSADYIEFYGRINDGRLDTEMFEKPEDHAAEYVSLFSDSTWFYLTVSPGTPNKRIVDAPNNVATTALPADQYFMYRWVNLFNSGWHNTGGGISFDGGTIGGFSNLYTLVSPNYSAGEGFTTQPIYNGNNPGIGIGPLHYYNASPLQGFYLSYRASGAYNGQRNVELVVNDSVSSRVFVPGFSLQRKDNDFLPASRIINDRLNIWFRIDNPWWQEAAYMNTLNVLYPRRFNFGGNRLFEFELPANANGNHLRIANFRFEGQRPIVYDFTNGKRYLGVINRDSINLLLEPSTNDRNLVMATNNATTITNITALKAVQFRNLTAPALIGSFTIVTDKSLFADGSANAVDEYANYRGSAAGGNFKVVVIDMDELADQYAFGIRKHPVAIRNYFRHTRPLHNLDQDHFLLLGRGIYNWTYRLAQGAAEMGRLNAVPSWGIPSGDILYAVEDINHAIPLMNIGRVPAIHAAELRDYLQKLKDYEDNVNNNKNAEDRAWQKRALFLSGSNDEFASSIFTVRNRFLARIAAGSKAGLDTFVSVRNTNGTPFYDQVSKAEKWLDNGLGIISFLGESSQSSIDYGIKKADEYKPKTGKYPIFIGAACNMAQMYYQGERFSRLDPNYAEYQLFTPNNGAIAFITNSDRGIINNVFLGTRYWLEHLVDSSYGRSLGQIQKTVVTNVHNALSSTSDQTGLYYAQSMFLLGDPAIRPFPHAKPDMAVSDKLIKITPSDPSIALDSVRIKVPVHNIGQAYYGPVNLEIKQVLRNGQQKLLLAKIFTRIVPADSVSVNVALDDMVLNDTGNLIVKVDPANSIDELTEQNNEAKLTIVLEHFGIKPVWPFNYSVMTSQPPLLKASTFDGLARVAAYRIEMDTTPRFNSALLKTWNIQSKGGVLKAPTDGVQWVNNRTYYWRTAYTVNGQAAKWYTSSFRYQTDGKAGFTQAHYWQWQQDDNVSTARVDTITRKYMTADEGQVVYASHGINGSSGFQDSHFAVELNGKNIATSACVGSSLIFNVFDPVTMNPIPNAGGFMGSGPVCQENRRNNFEYRYYPIDNRQQIVDFMNWIPKGSYVLVRMVLDPPQDSSLATFWARDTLRFGKNTLYYKLKEQGFYNLDSMNKHRTFAFFYRKDDSLRFKPEVAMSDGVYDRVNHNFYPWKPGRTLTRRSPDIGPAETWASASWTTEGFAGGASSSTNIKLFGHHKNGSTDLLQQSANGNGTFDLSGVNAADYPSMHFEYATTAGDVTKPDQLTSWTVAFSPKGDKALSSADFVDFKSDTLIEKLRLPELTVAVVNTSQYAVPATSYTIIAGMNNDTGVTVASGVVKALNPQDTALIYYKAANFPALGNHYLQLVMNNERSPLEKYHYNNQGIIRYKVIPNEFRLILFDAAGTANQVDATWQVTKEGPVAFYELEHGLSPDQFTVINRADKKTTNGDASYAYLHNNLPVGYHYYRLKITDVAGDVTYSQIEKVWIGKVQTVTLYPNPFRDVLNIVPFENDTPWQAAVYDASGRLMITLNRTGAARIDTRNWAYGQYYMQWIHGEEKETIPLLKQ